jgi:hypothetical protein
MAALDIAVGAACLATFPVIAHADSVTTADAVKDGLTVRAAPAPTGAVVGRLEKRFQFLRRVSTTADIYTDRA